MQALAPGRGTRLMAPDRYGGKFRLQVLVCDFDGQRWPKPIQHLSHRRDRPSTLPSDRRAGRWRCQPGPTALALLRRADVVVGGSRTLALLDDDIALTPSAVI